MTNTFITLLSWLSSNLSGRQVTTKDMNTFLVFGKGIEINNQLIFCLRFNIKDALLTKLYDHFLSHLSIALESFAAIKYWMNKIKQYKSHTN